MRVRLVIIELGDLSQLPDGAVRRFDGVDPRGIVVCRAAGRLYALADNCSHAAAPLSEGRLRGFMLTCPLHGAPFDVRDGSHAGPPAFAGVACYVVEEVDGIAAVSAHGDDVTDR